MKNRLVMFFQSQRDCIIQPRVATKELPWVDVQTTSTLKGLKPRAKNGASTPMGLKIFFGRLPRVARASQPWAGGRNPFGILGMCFTKIFGFSFVDAKFFCGIFFICALLVSVRAVETNFWHPAPSPLVTRWAAEVSPTNVWPEYPRPQLVRTEWKNLNGLWDYAITAEAMNHSPEFMGKILVPFPVESALSGVMTNLSEHGQLWYRRNFSVPENWRGQRVRLHFGAVDWRCQVRHHGFVALEK
jgi:hypothetical protein